jgi:hypothetical protein
MEDVVNRTKQVGNTVIISFDVPVFEVSIVVEQPKSFQLSQQDVVELLAEWSFFGNNENSTKLLLGICCLII